jgi:hypothetical protein
MAWVYGAIPVFAALSLLYSVANLAADLAGFPREGHGLSSGEEETD